MAEEVRSLAGRSAKAARETTGLIEKSTAAVRVGSEVAVQTADTLEDINGHVTRTADLVSEITAASLEQAQGRSQINEGLNQIDKVTQQNAATAEETASSVEELSSQAQVLQSELVKFRLADSADGQKAGNGTAR